MAEERVASADAPPAPSPNGSLSADPTDLGAVLRSLARLFADFAERRETLTETLERDIGFRAAFEAAADAVLIVDDQGWCIDANLAAAALLAVADRDGFLSRRVGDFVPPEAQDQFAAEWQLLLAAGEHVGEVTWQTMTGGRRRFACAARANVRRGRHLLVLRDVTERRRIEAEVAARARALALVARLGERAVAGAPWADLAVEAASGLADVLDVPFVAAFELQPGESELLLRAGVGWLPAEVGAAHVPAVPGTFAGAALEADEPIAVRDFAEAPRFAVPSLLHDHGAAGGAAAAIRGRDRRFGLLAVFTTQPRTWSEADLDLLRSLTSILAVPFERRAAVVQGTPGIPGTGPLREGPVGAPVYRALVQHDPELSLGLDADGVIRYASPASDRILGLLPEELQGRGLVEVVHRDDRVVVQAMLAYCRVVPDGAGPVEFRFLHRDGGWAWLEVVARDLLGDPRVGGVLVSGREVTARRRAEESRRRADERFARVFRAFPAGVLVTALDDGRVIEVNDRFLAILGYERHEFVGRSMLDLGIWSDPGDRAAIVHRLQEHGSVQEWEVQIATKAGDPRHAIVSVGQVSLDGEPCLVILVNDITDRKTAEGQLHRLANSDAVTGLPNRRHFMTAVERAIGGAQALGGRRVAVLFLDLDGFKSVNDRFGHEAGDGVLEEVARRLSASLRAGDVAARYGGDEFTVLLPRLSGEAEAAAVAERVIAALAVPYTVGDSRISISASVGIAVGEGNVAANELLREADIALYHAKARGRANYIFFEPGMRGASVLDSAGGEAVH